MSRLLRTFLLMGLLASKLTVVFLESTICASLLPVSREFKLLVVTNRHVFPNAFFRSVGAVADPESVKLRLRRRYGFPSSCPTLTARSALRFFTLRQL